MISLGEVDTIKLGFTGKKTRESVCVVSECVVSVCVVSVCVVSDCVRERESEKEK